MYFFLDEKVPKNQGCEHYGAYPHLRSLNCTNSLLSVAQTVRSFNGSVYECIIRLRRMNAVMLKAGLNSRPDVREPPAMLLLMGTLALFWVGCKQPDLCGGGLQ